MDAVLSETKRVFSFTNIIGYILGLLGLSIFAVTQFITALLPLLFAPLVCATFGLLLYKSQSNNVQTNIVPRPTIAPVQN